jgi:hypothetical protein
VSQCAKLRVAGWTWAVYTRLVLRLMIFTASVRNILDAPSYWKCSDRVITETECVVLTLTVLPGNIQRFSQHHILVGWKIRGL